MAATGGKSKEQWLVGRSVRDMSPWALYTRREERERDMIYERDEGDQGYGPAIWVPHVNIEYACRPIWTSCETRTDIDDLNG